MDAVSAVEKQAAIAIKLERSVSEKIATLKKAEDDLKAEWKKVEALMIDNDVKSVKGEWGTLTIAEKLNWKITGKIPPRFMKTVPDTTKLSTIYRLEGKAPENAQPYITKYLTRRIK